MTRIEVDTAEQLVTLLVAGGIDPAQWGAGATKTPADLWQELQKGESELHGPPLLRVVRGVVQVLIRRGDTVLIEVEQVFQDGRTRRRDQPPSEKLRPGEDYTAAALRCLAEEIDVAPDAVTLIEASYRRWEMISDSLSYPGLPTHYTFHVVEAHVAALPPTDFWTDEVTDNPHDPVARHHWSWQPDGAAALNDDVQR